MASSSENDLPRHCLDWYLGDVLDANSDELNAVEYICCYHNLKGTPRYNASNPEMWLLNEDAQAVMQLTDRHPDFSQVTEDRDDMDYDSVEQPTIDLQTDGRFEALLRTVRGDLELQNQAKVWWRKSFEVAPPGYVCPLLQQQDRDYGSQAF